jgi:signal transduction histidine kinase
VDLYEPIRLLRRLLALVGVGTDETTVDPGSSHRRRALMEGALAVTSAPADGRLEPVLHLIVQVAARVAGAAAAVVVLGPDGRAERYAGEGLDGCMRDTVLRPDVLAALARALRAANGALGPEAVEGGIGRTLAAVAPHGFLALPLGRGGSALLVLMEPAGDGFDEEAIALTALVSLLAGASLETAQRVEDLRCLVARRLALRDQELRRTARTLHEGLGQHLAAAKAQLQALAPLLDTSASGARDCLNDARGLVEQTLGEMRELAQEMRPSVLDDFGYVQALRWYVGRLQGRACVSLRVEVEGAEGRLPHEVESALYRATEEALGAIVRRDESRPLRVLYHRDCAAVRLEIASRPPERQSLVAIRERLRPFGGEVRVTQEPDTFALELPAIAAAT